MSNLNIQLKSDLCASNGESIGYGIDSTICTDSYGFPYIPAKRLLGCLRDSAIKLRKYGLPEATMENIDAIFGNANGREGCLFLKNAEILGIESLHTYIDNLRKERTREYLIRESTEEKVIRKYSSVRGQTKIGIDGKAEEGSLRFIRVLNQYDPITKVPLEFSAEMDVTQLNEEQKGLLEKACVTLRHIGTNRNRGLGNVHIVPCLESQKSDAIEKISEKIVDVSTGETDQVSIQYQVTFDSPVTVQEYLENGSQIKARTMIGIFAGIYLKNYKIADEVFERLFLTGEVKWSALNPVVNGFPSEPIPAMVMRLKNGGGKLINIFLCEQEDWKKLKPKSMDGSFISCEGNDKGSPIFYVSQPETEIAYHNRIHGEEGSEGVKKGLYMQEALKAGMVYSGAIMLPKELCSQVKKLFFTETIRMGRSKKVQYGMGSIQKVIISDAPQKRVQAKEEPVFAVLRSDLILQDQATFRTDSSFVRSAIEKETGLVNQIPDHFYDICRYHVLTGYHAMWHMQKPKIQAVMGGSVYCFMGKEGMYPKKIIIGEYQQEGMGVVELIPLHELKQFKNIQYGNITVKQYQEDEVVQKKFENMLLFEAAMTEIHEYTFLYMKRNAKELKNLPVRRLRQMLIDSDSIIEFCNLIQSMKESDVDSENKGKKKNSEIFIQNFYQMKNKKIGWQAMLNNQTLCNALKENEKVEKMIEQQWKEPLSNVFHMIHYQKEKKE